MSKKRGRPMKGAERLESRLGFRIPQGLHNEVLRVCNERNITKSEFILESITSNLKQAQFESLFKRKEAE